MARAANEHEILDQAVEAFRRATGLEARIRQNRDLQKIVPGERTLRADAAIQVLRGGKWRTFDLEFRPWLTATTAGLLEHEYRQKQNWILVTRYAQPAIAEQLRGLRIQYIDTAGNVFLDTEDLLILVRGQKRADPRVAAGIERPFKPAGMRVIFALLCNPGLERKTYRDIAEITKTALGTIDWTMQDLQHMGHLLNVENVGRRIVNREALFDKWVAAYPQQLRPRQFLGRFAAQAVDWWRNADLETFRALWGGETAAAFITGYLEPEVATIYLDRNLNEFLHRFKLKKDPLGRVEIFRHFWNFEPQDRHAQTVPAPLVYADLLATGEERNVQTARVLREKELARYIR